jgi:hypothetical protein
VGVASWAGLYRGLVVAFFASALVVGCGLDLSGLEEGFPFDDGGADASGGFDSTIEASVDSGADAGGGGDTSTTGGDVVAGGDTGAGDDAVSLGDDASDTGGSSVDAPAVDGCVPAGPEDCTDGIDNDCDGLTDCEDPACSQQGYLCVPTPPNGWSFVGFSADSEPGCPSGQQTSNVDVDPVLQQASCSCTCNVGNAPTCTGHVTTMYGMGGGTCPTNGGMFAADGMCNYTPVTVEPFVQVGQPAGSGGTCVPNPTTTVPAAGSTRGQICSGETKFGGGCPGGQVCALAQSAFQACIAKGGQLGCPSGAYGNVHYAGTLNDSRGCSKCNCNGTPSCSLQWIFYNTGNCSGQVGLTLNPDGACQATMAGGMVYYGSSRLTGSASDAGCAPPQMQPMPTGQLSINGEQTVCCQ